MNRTEVLITAAAPVELDTSWEMFGPRRLRIVGGGDGVRLQIGIDERELHGYTLDRTLSNIRRMLDALREDGHQIDVELIETCRAVRMKSI